MSDTDNRRKKLNTREIAELAVICALMFAGKEALSSLPNIHPVMVLIIYAGINFGWKAMYPVEAFVMLEIAVYGFGIWTAMYIWIWPLALALVILFRKNKSILFWAALSGGFGLIFGALCAFPYLFFGGKAVFLSFWIAGIPYDLLHCAGNAALTAALLPLLFKLRKPSHE